MRSFKIPFIVEEEEKVFGGYISLRQALYLFIAALGLRVFWFHMPIALKLILFVGFVSLMIAFAFLKIDNTYFDAYVIRLIKYFTRKKKYFYGEDQHTWDG
jgi:hypothetical protein